jgi:hypothetical protein
MAGGGGSGAVAQRKDTGRDSALEREVLLQSVRRALGTIPGAEVPDPTHGHWPRLLSLAQEHRVVTLLNKGLRGTSGIAPPIQGWMDIYCRTSVSHNLSLASELVDVMAAMERADIAAVPFKGPVWARLLYGNLADREIADLDLFVDRPKVDEAARVLRDRGFVSVPTDAVPAADGKDIEFVHGRTGVHLELHWSACEPWLDARLSRLRLWTPRNTASLLDCDVPVPSPENMYFLLAIHGFRDGWESLKWVCDIVKLLQVFPDLDFHAILRVADKASRRRVVLLPLALAQRLFGVEVPPAGAEAIACDPMVSEIATQIERRFYSAETDHVQSGPDTAAGRLYLEWYRVQTCDTAWERLGWHTKFLLKLLEPNQNDLARFSGKLPKGAYWIVRPWRLLRSFGFSGTLRLGRQFLSRCVPQRLRNSS